MNPPTDTNKTMAIACAHVAEGIAEIQLGRPCSRSVSIVTSSKETPAELKSITPPSRGHSVAIENPVTNALSVTHGI